MMLTRYIRKCSWHEAQPLSCQVAVQVSKICLTIMLCELRSCTTKVHGYFDSETIVSRYEMSSLLDLMLQWPASKCPKTKVPLAVNQLVITEFRKKKKKTQGGGLSKECTRATCRSWCSSGGAQARGSEASWITDRTH